MVLTVLPLTLGLFLSACAQQGTSSSATTVVVSSSQIPSGPPELSYLGNVSGANYVASDIAALLQPGANPYTISGTARFFFRNEVTGIVSGPSAIRSAEVRVSDSTGRVVVGTETNSSGAFSFLIPSDGGTYTVAITTRAANSNNHVSVLNGPETNTFYSISQTFVADATKNLGNIDAPATGSVIGAAFNIYNQVHRAIDYLKANASSCSGTITAGCTNFSAQSLVKATVYWRLGFNPGSYLGLSPISFVTQSNGMNMMFILGGQNGNFTNTDTDHWDNSVILHEYGHFLELAYSQSDSPGGAHSFAQLIDPRLAWSEGWANFFQAAVRNLSNYRDMLAMDSGAPSVGILISLTSQTVGSGAGTISDAPVDNGEGVYREFSISRQLWQYLGTSGFTFQDIWTVFAGNALTVGGTTYNGFRSSSVSFRNMGLLWEVHQQIFPSRNISSILTNEKTNSNRAFYATPVTLGTGCSTTATLSGGSESYIGTRPAAAQRWYVIDHAGGAFTVSGSCSGCIAADRVYWQVYPETHVIMTNGQAQELTNSRTALTTTTQNLAAGRYLLNVFRWGGTVARNVVVQYNGQNICPTQ